MRAASYTWSAIYMIDVTALTRRVCHRRGRIGSARIGRRDRRYVQMGSRWLSVAITGQFEQLWRVLVWELAKSGSVVCDKC